MALTGGCLCGAVRYEIAGTLGRTGHCHCSMCRKSHGAAFVTWAMVEPEQFRWTSGTELVTQYESSPGRARCFCSRCGSALVSMHCGDVLEVALGSTDGDPGVRPGEHIFVGSRACWYEIADALPRFEEWPPGFEG